MPRTLTTSLLIALLVLTGGVVFHSQDTPRFAIERIGEAIATRDALLLEKHVDIDAVIDAAADSILNADSSAAAAASHALPLRRAELAAMIRDAVLAAFLSGEALPRDAIEIEEMQRRGRVARVTVRLHTPRDGSHVFDLALEKRADGWVLVEVANLPDHIGL